MKRFPVQNIMHYVSVISLAGKKPGGRILSVAYFKRYLPVEVRRFSQLFVSTMGAPFVQIRYDYLYECCCYYCFTDNDYVYECCCSCFTDNKLSEVLSRLDSLTTPFQHYWKHWKESNQEFKWKQTNNWMKTKMTSMNGWHQTIKKKIIGI